MSRALAHSLQAAIAAAALLAAGDAAALRCQHELITKGDTSVELERWCGKPIAVRSYYAPRAFVDRRGNLLFPGFSQEVLVEEWTYNFGPRRLMRVVRIENGIVTDIESLGYGFLEDPRRDAG